MRSEWPAASVAVSAGIVFYESSYRLLRRMTKGRTLDATIGMTAHFDGSRVAKQSTGVQVASILVTSFESL